MPTLAAWSQAKIALETVAGRDMPPTSSGIARGHQPGFAKRLQGLGDLRIRTTLPSHRSPVRSGPPCDCGLELVLGDLLGKREHVVPVVESLVAVAVALGQPPTSSHLLS